MADLTTQPRESGIKVVHATAGRLRLRATRENRHTLETIAQQLRQQEGIYEVKLKENTGSLVVNFDVTSLPLSQMFEVLTGYDISGLPERLPPSHQRELDAPSQSVNALEKVPGKVLESLIPMTAGLLVTRLLKVSGWLSLSIYVAIAVVTRQMIEQLKPEFLHFLESQKGRGGEGEREKLLIPNVQFKIHAPKSKIDIIHSTPGRVRFRVPQVADDPDYAQRLEQLVKSTVDVTKVRVNPTAASVAIAYQAGSMSDAQMRSHLASLIQTAAPTQTSKSSASEIVAMPNLTDSQEKGKM